MSSGIKFLNQINWKILKGLEESNPPTHLWSTSWKCDLYSFLFNQFVITDFVVPIFIIISAHGSASMNAVEWEPKLYIVKC